MLTLYLTHGLQYSYCYKDVYVMMLGPNSEVDPVDNH